MKTTLVITVLVGLVSLFVLQWLSSLKTKFKKRTQPINLRSMSTLLYTLVYVALLSVPALLFWTEVADTKIFYLIFLYTFSLGLIHNYTHYRFINWAQKQVDFLPDFLFTLILAMFGCAAFTLIATYVVFKFDRPFFLYAYLFLPFTFGILIRKVIYLFEEVQRFIPDYPLFKFRDGAIGSSRDEIKYSKDIRVNFMFPASNDTDILHAIKYVLYSDIQFGINVYEMIESYPKNPAHNGKIIEIKDKFGKEYEYLFYIEPKNFWQRLWGEKRIIDTSKSPILNKIEEGEIIQTQRYTA